MKAVILAGGLGTRISEESHLRPKPMIEIGGRPILWHIMKLYSHHGIQEFIICLGYKGYVIKEYFSNYFLHMSDVLIDIQLNEMNILKKKAEPWKITLIDTGDTTDTGGRLKRVAEYVQDEAAFCFTYGDGVTDLDITAQLAFHRAHGRLATVTAIAPPGRYGALVLADDGSEIESFEEKPSGDGNRINGGFFVLSPKTIDHIKGDKTSWESETMQILVANQQIAAYCHDGFWQAMDTLRDKNRLEDLWSSGRAPWKLWD